MPTLDAPTLEDRALDEMPLDDLCIATIRTLAMDAVERANSGHPGTPMALASAAYVLWTRLMRYNPGDPHWFDRDRFVLSNGHASMLLYALLHLRGFDLSLDDIRRFRQWGSKTPGHPEHAHVPGVDTTTGPLGQGLMNASGMAIAEAHLAAVLNRPGHTLVDHHTFVFCSDGDFMEGASHEAGSLAGHLKLGKLVVLYDDTETVLPAYVTARLAVEAASPQGWLEWAGCAGDVIGVERFGASAPGKENFMHYGFTVDNVVARAVKLLEAAR